MNQQLVGRCIGAVAALCSAVLCAITLTVFVLGIREHGIVRILFIVLWPLAMLAVIVMFQSLSTFAVLLQRPDSSRPLIMAGIHTVLGTMACFIARFSFPSLWFGLGILGIAACGAFAAWSFARGPKTR